MNNLHPTLRYLLGALITIPCLPILYLQARGVRNSIEDLPEAKDLSGVTGDNMEGFQVIALGESTAAGVGVESHHLGFMGTFAKEVADRFQVTVNWRVYAKSGYTAKKTHQELVGDISEESTDLIVISLGGNDTFRLSTPWQWSRQIKILINELREKFATTPILFSSMPPVGQFPAFTPLMQWVFGSQVKILGDQLAITVKNMEGVYYHDQSIRIEDWEKRFGVKPDITAYFSDGVHPSQYTYQILAKDLFQFSIKNASQLYNIQQNS